MLDIKIYQINISRDTNSVKFMSYDSIEKYQGTSVVDSSIYDKIWAGSVEAATLEDVYTIFNTAHPADFTGHSLSKSDVVEVIVRDTGDKPSSYFYYCDTTGFKRIDFEPEKCSYGEHIIKEPKISLWGRLGVSLEITPSELEILLKGGINAQDKLIDLIRSDKAIITGETYFPEAANEDHITDDLEFNINDVPLQADIPDNKLDITLSTLDSIINNAASRSSNQITGEQKPEKGRGNYL